MTDPIAVPRAADHGSGSGPREPAGRAYWGASPYVPALDGVRGAAILLVLVYHFALHGLARPSALPGKLLYKLALGGWIGVDLFFVLSGFLITGILYDAKGRGHFFRNFYARRCLRIFPLYFAVLAIVLGLLPRLVHGRTGLSALVDDGVWYWTYTTNVMVARDGWPNSLALGHFWSLAVEEQFYLVWPLVIFSFGRGRLLAVCVSCVVLSLCLRVGLHSSHHGDAAYVLMPARMDALAAGALVALIGRGPNGFVPFRRWARRVAFTAGTALAAIAVSHGGLTNGDALVLTIGLTLLACLFASLLVLVLPAEHTNRVGGLFESASLRFLGRYSYGLYVFHHPLLFLLTSAAAATTLPWLPRGALPRRLVILGAVAGLSLGLAVLSWHLFERHFLRLKGRFAYGGSMQDQRHRGLVPPARLTA